MLQDLYFSRFSTGYAGRTKSNSGLLKSMVESPHPKKNTDDAFQKSEKQPAIKIEKVNVTKEIAEAIKRRGAPTSERLGQIADSFFIHVY